MKPSVYIETSIVSYLTARPSHDVVSVATQRLTCDWWDTKRDLFDLFVSPLVLAEAEQGDVEAAARRLKALEFISSLEITVEADALASELLTQAALPSKAQDDALHIALAAVHGITYLLTWNCRHINNAEKKPIIRDICFKAGYQCPEICSPCELCGGVDND